MEAFCNFLSSDALAVKLKIQWIIIEQERVQLSGKDSAIEWIKAL